MQKHPELRRQRGSVLAGVIVLSMIMTLAAGGFVLASSFVTGTQLDVKNIRLLQFAGESAAQMGVRHMRNYSASQLTAIARGATKEITSGYTTFQDASDRAAMKSPKYRLAFEKFSDSDTIGMKAWTTFEGRSDTVYITWKIVPTWTTPVFDQPSDLTMRDWKDTLLAYRP